MKHFIRFNGFEFNCASVEEIEALHNQVTHVFELFHLDGSPSVIMGDAFGKDYTQEQMQGIIYGTAAGILPGTVVWFSDDKEDTKNTVLRTEPIFIGTEL